MGKFTEKEKNRIESGVAESKKRMSDRCKEMSGIAIQMLEWVAEGIHGNEKTIEMFRELADGCEKTKETFKYLGMQDEVKECCAQKEIFLKALGILTKEAIPV